MIDKTVKRGRPCSNIFRGGRLFKSGRGIMTAPAIVIGGGLVLIPSAPAHADDCGAYTAPNQTITCTAATYIPPSPILYPNVDGLTLIINDPALDIASAGSPISVVAQAASTNNIAIDVQALGTISSTNNNAFAVVARHTGAAGNADVTISAGTINATGIQAHGGHAWISNAASTGATSVILNGGTITATGNRGRGIYSRNQGAGDATAIMNGGSMNTTNNEGHGVLANVDNLTSSATATAVMNSGSISTNFDRARGVYALSRGLGSSSAIMNGGDVQTMGATAFGVQALNTNVDAIGPTTVSMTGGRVVTNGALSYGLLSQNRGSGAAVITMSGGTVEALGDTAGGALALGAATQITLSGGDIRATGTGLWSIAGSGASQVTVSGGSVTSGTAATSSFPTAAIWTNSELLNTVTIMGGARVDGAGSGIAIREGDANLDGIDEDANVAIITAAGDVTGDAVLGLGNDVFNLTGGSFVGDIYGDDARAAGLSFADFVSLYSGVFTEEQLRGVAPVNGVGQDDTFNWTGGTFGSTFFGGNGSDVANITAASFDGTYHILDGGDDHAAADGWVDVLTLSGNVSGAINGANIRNWERVNLDAVAVGIADGALQVGADAGSGLFLSNGTVLDQSGVGLALIGNMTNAATLTMQNNAAGDVVTVNGDYRSDGGSLRLDTQFNNGVTDVTDRLVVERSITLSGATILDIAAAPGSVGAGTDANNNGMIDDGEGILLVEVRGANPAADSAVDAFSLAGGRINQDGVLYFLHRTTSGGDWYLANRLDINGRGVCGGSVTVNSGASEVLGCVTNDTITLGDAGNVTGDIEGAGGGDTIAILGNASVAGTIFGGGNGQDASAAGDSSNTFTINTTGTVGAVQAGDAGDIINLVNGAVTNNALGGAGADVVTLSGAGVGGVIDGRDGNDVIALNGGSAGSVLGGAGDDALNWNSAVATTPVVDMGSGNDVLSINDPVINLVGVGLDGGAGADTLALNNAWSGNLTGAATTNWEVININGGNVAVIDAAITAGVIGVNAGGTLNGSNNLAVTGDVVVGTGSGLIAGNDAGLNAMVINGNLANAGTVDLGGASGIAAAGDRLSVGGNYAGTGATIRFDTVLGGSNATDTIVVAGNFEGANTAVVTNVGGTGALTTGDGIRLVQVDGTSPAGALTLAGDTIDVGAFRYGLFNGGLANPNDQDWYLRSRTRDIVVPIIGMARAAQDMGLTSLGTLHERVGEQEHLGLQTADSGFLKGMWGRAIGKDYSDTARSADFGNSRSNNRFGGLQMGVDLYRKVAASGAHTHVGVFGGHLWSQSTQFMVTPVGTGPIGQTRSDGWVMGGYLTHYTASDLYLDAVVQHDWIDHRASAADGTRADARSRNLQVSVETGRAFGTKWKFEPQAQLIFGDLRFDRFNDTAGVANRVENENSWTGRGGFRLKRSYDYDENSNGGLFTIYAKANLWHRLGGGATTLAIGVSNPGVVLLRETWGDVGLGTTFSISKGAEFFADAEVEFGLNQGGTALNGRTGVRIRF